jgi:hypothetical protein
MKLLRQIPIDLRRAVRTAARRAARPYASVIELESRTVFAANHIQEQDESPWRVRDYQIASLESRAPRKVNCCARDVGKTAEIILSACWASVCMPCKTALVTAPLDNMLQPVMHEIRRQCESNPGLSANYDGSAMSPSWRFQFKNGFKLYGRIGGLTGLNYKGMHCDWVWVDEAQDMTQQAWRELYPAVKPGGRLWVYGVPNGVRGDFFKHAKDPTWEHWDWPMHLNPHVQPSDLERLQRVFGGKTAPAYLHNVMGSFCTASTLAFPVELIQHTHRWYVFSTYDAESNSFSREIFCHRFGLCYLGVDLGFADDPTEVTVLEETDDGSLETAARVHIGHATYDKLAEILAKMVEIWRPQRVGIDAGGPGLPVVHLLASRNLQTMVYPVFFNAWVTWRPPELEGGIRGYLKNLVTDAMAAEIASGTLRFSPSDPERLEQYGAQTVIETATGRVAYSKGNDHIVDADRCAFFAARSHLFTSSVEPTFTGIRVETFGALPGDYGGAYPLREAL